MEEKNEEEKEDLDEVETRQDQHNVMPGDNGHISAEQELQTQIAIKPDWVVKFGLSSCIRYKFGHGMRAKRVSKCLLVFSLGTHYSTTYHRLLLFYVASISPSLD